MSETRLGVPCYVHPGIHLDSTSNLKTVIDEVVEKPGSISCNTKSLFELGEITQRFKRMTKSFMSSQKNKN